MSSRFLQDRASSPAATVFRHDAKRGAIHLPDQRRVLAFAEPLVQSLHFSIIETMGEAAQDVLYRSGFEWALQDMRQLAGRIRQEAGDPDFDFWKLDPGEVFTRWWSLHAAVGWGAATFDQRAAARGLLLVELRHSIVADVFAGADQPVCHLYAGLFAGAQSFLDQAERHGVEIQCAAMGQPACRFVIGPGADVDAAEAWRQQGVAAPEIIRRFG